MSLEDVKLLLPKDVLENPDLITDIISKKSWMLLNIEDQNHLKNFLPKQPDKDETLNRLFSGESMSQLPSSSNPIKDIQNKLKLEQDEAKNELIKEYNETIKLRNDLYRVQRMYELIKRSIVDQNNIENGIESHLISPKLNSTKSKDIISKTALTKYNSVKESVKQQITNSTKFSSEDLETSEDSDDDFTLVKFKEGPFSIYKESLYQHQKRRKMNVNTPDLDVSGIHLSEVTERTILKKKKSSDVFNRRKKEDMKAASTSKNQNRVRLKRIGDKLKVRRLTGLSSKKYLDKSRKCGNICPSCFFDLIRQTILLSHEKTTSMVSDVNFKSSNRSSEIQIQHLVADWLKSNQASSYDWTSSRADWPSLTPSALQYLRSSRSNDDVIAKSLPLVVVENGVWSWKQSSDNDDVNNKQLLNTLCEKWIENLNISELQTESFQKQEERRFCLPHQVFVYLVNGTQYKVPPVKGCLSGPTSKPKAAREHCLLRSERPAKVTLLALTRDAVARLPNGFGTRNDICNLVKQSQYLQSNITDQQIHSAVSGSLDRLHGESDPCVKYDSLLKGWVYLHADRSIEELEKMHKKHLTLPKKRASNKSKKTNNKKVNTKAANEFKLVKSSKSSPTSSIASSSRDPDIPINNRLKKITKEDIQQTSLPETDFKQITESSSNQLDSERSVDSVGKIFYKRLMTQIQQHQPPPGQPGLTLILRPGGPSNTNKTKGEMLRLITTSGGKKKSQAATTSSATNQSQKYLSDEALERLSQHLSAASNRPIKIIHQSSGLVISSNSAAQNNPKTLKK